jgi:6-phosphogluconolactonase
MPSDPKITCVYVGNSDAQDLSILELHADGTLSERGSVAVHRPSRPGRSMLMAVSAHKKFLYVGFLSGEACSSASTYSIDPGTGLLSHLGETQLADVMSYLSLDRSGRYLLCASYAGNKVTVNAIAADGTVGETLHILPTEPKAHCVLADPANRTVLHTSLGGDQIRQDGFDGETGRLLPLTPRAVLVRPHAGPRFLQFSRDGRFVYVINELDGSLDVFPYDLAEGKLQSSVQTVTVLPDRFSGKPWAADIHLTPDGRYLYGSERTSSTLAAFRVDTGTGLLTPVGSFATATQPRAFDIDPSGRYLVSSGQLSNSLVSHAIDAATGRLTTVGEYPVGPGPLWVQIVALP